MIETSGVIRPRFAKSPHLAGREENPHGIRQPAAQAHHHRRLIWPEPVDTARGKAATALRWFSGWLLAVLIAMANPLLAAEIQLSLDRNPVPINESFTLTFTADAEPDGDPDFSPLEDQFEILNQGQSSQFSIINGKASRQVTWQLQVIAKQPGTLQIPSIAFGSDRSRPFSVTVTNGAVRGKQGGEASLYLEAEAEPKNPYVQAQVILTIRVLSRVAFSGDLSQPEIPDAVVEKLDEDREFVSLRDGVQFKVNERRYAVFPQKSGRLTIGPINLTAQLAAGGG
ncbi:MAG: BatD family protein, partial [Methylococcus sp.]